MEDKKVKLVVKRKGQQDEIKENLTLQEAKRLRIELLIAFPKAFAEKRMKVLIQSQK